MYEKQDSSELIYTQVFKTVHLEIESPSIQLSESAWIVRSPSFVNMPHGVDLGFAAFFSGFDDPQFGLMKFLQSLVSSPVILRATHTEEESEKTPFQIHDCSYAATAISIVCDPWFVVGIENFSNNRDPAHPSLSPYTTFFVGDSSEEPAKIFRDAEEKLIRAYEFVYRSLALSSWDSVEGRLVLMFLRCVTRTPYQRFAVLKLGLDHLFTEWHATVLNGALFFEYLLTKESDDRRGGVRHWNKTFSPYSQLDEDLIDILFQYRHIVAHFNPTRARSRIEEWKKKGGLDDEAALSGIRRSIWFNAKTCLRAIVDYDDKFQYFWRSKP